MFADFGWFLCGQNEVTESNNNLGIDKLILIGEVLVYISQVLVGHLDKNRVYNDEDRKLYTIASIAKLSSFNSGA